MAVDPDAVRTRLVGENGTLDEDELARVCAAVDEWADRHYDVTDPPADFEQGLIMRASRLYRRKHSPDGISGADDLAPIRVPTFDAEEARLLSGRLKTAGLFGPSENVVEE